MANFYREHPSEEIAFRLFGNGDNEIYNSNYRIDPIAIPLLLSILEQLSKFHRGPLKLFLNNNYATSSALEFLYRANFFKTAGDKDYYHQSGNSIISYNAEYLGAFKGKEIRKDHLVRSYKKDDYSTIEFQLYNEILLRDQINSMTSYYVQEHFRELLFDNPNTIAYHNTYIDILSELITNGVIHSGSTTYAMMFVDRYRTKFSISDNGIGLKKSLDTKVFFPFYYSKDEFRNSLEKKETKFSPVFIENLIDIFEALFYSSIKEREGIFDLMLNVVLNSQGYFRLHTDNCQIIVTNRIFKYLSSLQKIRASILYTHKLNENTELDNSIYKKDIVEYKNQIKKLFAKMLSVTIDYYSEETQFSSIRFFNVKFKGVHIEVEIPNR
ncbi:MULTISPECIES: ATP-binding protein [Chryseobacterium]|uniref:ATP-binding protein n=1 Tax=Chryseobacterium TaxID=59732 RepID=UPI000F4FE0D7|nr:MULTISPECIES: ATP-binding protein [Chryseobacterium]MPS63853.1 ATP-binding protein [Chryseobacterium sp.]